MRLNLGCGPNVFAGWLNVDRENVNHTFLNHLRRTSNFDGWPEWQQELGRALHAGETFETAQQDVTENQAENAIRIGDQVFWNCCDAIYLGQVVEHLNPIHQLPQLLRRCYGALKPGGVLRMTTPDIELIFEVYTKGDMGRFAQEQPEFYARATPEEQLSYLLFGATGPDSTQTNYEGHMHCWSHGSLKRVVIAAGFAETEISSWPSVRLPDVRDFGQSHSFALEAMK